MPPDQLWMGKERQLLLKAMMDFPFTVWSLLLPMYALRMSGLTCTT